ncbi:unnamed protein product [Haemonchus placei]|uniref:Uncharacterized protein n=1 Tax=Haemonchus placei TaxID=6290 RepID=A0A0N4X988_HAEPC|nr:unnamed protein product [Haemonchus placei]
MTSLLGGSSILHIANRLGGLKKEVPSEGEYLLALVTVFEGIYRIRPRFGSRDRIKVTSKGEERHQDQR